MIERARAEGTEPNWTPEAFPALDWRIKSEATAIMRDVTGRRARIFAAALPPAQAALLVEEAERLADEAKLGDGFATLRWRELVAAAWISWRLSRPVRARRDIGPSTTSRVNPWAGGRVVDGYARQAFCLLMRDLRTGSPMSISKLFYRNGSGVQGVFGYLARPAPTADRRGLPRIDGALGLYSRFQPRADKSKYVGPPKKGSDGNALLDANGNVQRYALSEHWYHREMCGRRAVAQADRGTKPRPRAPTAIGCSSHTSTPARSLPSTRATGPECRSRSWGAPRPAGIRTIPCAHARWTTSRRPCARGSCVRVGTGRSRRRATSRSGAAPSL